MSTLRLALAPAILATVLQLHAVPIRIACVGDSITEGAGLSNPATESYPAKLGRLLGTNYVVRNFGVGGRTLLKQGDFPYWKEAAFKTSHDWLPDIVIIQLGTNDSKPYNWRYGTNFVAQYEELVASYVALTNPATVMVCTPCPVYGNGAYDIKPGTIATNIAPSLRDLASRQNLELIDLHARLAGHPEWFPDTVHPNSKGMTAMAAVVVSVLLGEAVGQTPPSLSVQRGPGTRVILSWPAAWRGVIPQFTSALRGSNTVWSVSEPVIYLDGDMLHQTNSMSGSARLYLLRQP
jgi:acyl-CoA thioesterase-1